MAARFNAAVATLAFLLLGATPFSGARAPEASTREGSLPLADRLQTAGPVVVHVLVPLCDNEQIVCGSARAGDPDDLEHNLYWGAIFGQKRFFSRKASAFEQVSTSAGSGAHLERAVFRRFVDAKPWGREGTVELLVVFDAFRGDRIDEVVDRFFDEAQSGATVAFDDGEQKRVVPVTVVGYAGHNRMMDGKRAPPLREGVKGKPIPSFVMACFSRRYFDASLKARGSRTLLMTKQLMAPEGYVLEAIVNGIADNAAPETIKRKAVQAYAKWQKIDERAASTIFD